MLRWVVLRHTLSDGTWHFDWLFETAADQGLVSLRVQSELCAGEFACERMGEHRRAYLTFEGDIGGGRGSVARVQAGEIIRIVADDISVRAYLQVATQHDSQRFHIDATSTRVVVTAMAQ
ncbi:hypothetical protein LBMAG48_10020 [Phycisphaerae bacterium]|jgi:hypothetical protein|nr:hypothetical protein LBMAG48_10020 [Phycisphaerae bacterium]